MLEDESIIWVMAYMVSLSRGDDNDTANKVANFAEDDFLLKKESRGVWSDD